MIYERLRAVAHRAMDTERADHTLGATGLVHEAYLKLAKNRSKPWSNEAHYFVAAAEAMRRILVDHARSRNSHKRGGGRPVRRLNMADISSVAADASPDEVLALDGAFSRFEEEDGRAASVVRLRFYAGLSVDRTATVLGLSERTVAREWSFARARLYELLAELEAEQLGQSANQLDDQPADGPTE